MATTCIPEGPFANFACLLVLDRATGDDGWQRSRGALLESVHRVDHLCGLVVQVILVKWVLSSTAAILCLGVNRRDEGRWRRRKEIEAVEGGVDDSLI